MSDHNGTCYKTNSLIILVSIAKTCVAICRFDVCTSTCTSFILKILKMFLNLANEIYYVVSMK